ncbi:hypothetical protein [Kitasatospora sp. NPDC050543]|uniref:hypothetical protein n=1 Tax=Kitasatospora sp. NPDC050543 TaxID=3364054 RepID=UPI0037BB7CB0
MSRRHKILHAPIAEGLRALPGEWGLVDNYVWRSAARGTAHHIQTGALRAYQPAGSFEAEVRHDADGDALVYARYVGRPRSGSDTGRPGCSCEQCRAAMRAYSRRRNLMAATGRQLTIDAAPVTAHLRRLWAAGAGWNELVAVTSCSSSSISAYLNGTRTIVRRTTACRILSVRLAQVICPNRSVSALGSVRRLRALVAAGHQIQEISQACGIDQTTVSYLVNQHIETARAATHQAIDAAFERLSMVPGTDTRSIARGRQNGWPAARMGQPGRPQRGAASRHGGVPPGGDRRGRCRARQSAPPTRGHRRAARRQLELHRQHPLAAGEAAPSGLSVTPRHTPAATAGRDEPPTTPIGEPR